MSIEYTYEIIAVDEAAKVMEIVYTSPDRPTMHISARLPYVGESLDALVSMYSPVRFWEEQEMQVKLPTVGTKGTSTPIPSITEPTVHNYIIAIQIMLDSTAQEKGYDSILSACTYANSVVPKFKAEGQACVEWRDNVWYTCHNLLSKLEAGEIAKPTIQEVLQSMPDIQWPQA